MTKRNLIIVIILLAIIDMVAAGWYMSRRIEASGKSQNFFEQRDSTEAVAEADTTINASQADVFSDLQHNTYYFAANEPAINGDQTSYYTSIKHVKVKWPKKINGDVELATLNKELIKRAFGNTQSQMKDARYAYLKEPNFNEPVGDDFRTLSSAPKIYPVYGNVSQVLVYPYMTSQRLLVMEIDKVNYNGNASSESSTFVHYDRLRHRVLSRTDILVTDTEKENKLLKVINKKIDELNKSRGENSQIQHALNVPAEVCCGKKGVLFQFKHGTIASEPMEILVDYEKLEPFFTESFAQLVSYNDGYHMYPKDIKPEPLNPTASTTKKAETTVKKNKYSSGKSKVVKPTRTKKRRYNGAKRRSGHRIHAVRHQRSHRQR